MSEVSHWMHVNIFTIEQAAALWCRTDPAKLQFVDSFNPSEILAIKQMLFAGIFGKELPVDTSTNGFVLIGDHSKSLVTRTSLEVLARAKNLFPAFLFDTLLPFDDISQTPNVRIGSISIPSTPPAANRGGRPPEYDWDKFTLEIIRRANTPDGLPTTQAELIRDMLQWFSATEGREPAESAVKLRVSKIYRYMDEAKNPAE